GVVGLEQNREGRLAGGAGHGSAAAGRVPGVTVVVGRICPPHPCRVFRKLGLTERISGAAHLLRQSFLHPSFNCFSSVLTACGGRMFHGAIRFKIPSLTISV